MITTLPATRGARIPAPTGAARLTLAPTPDYPTHLATFGKRPPGSQALLAKLRESGLTGRGGGAFATWRKIAGLPTSDRRSGRVSVVGNAAEGEPLSSKDATLLRVAPHLVVDGLLLVAGSVGAHRVLLYAPAAALGGLTRALAERPDCGAIELCQAADSFVAGEASAVLNAIAGGPPVPQDRTVRLTVSGLSGNPTLVHNVETLAHIALIARFGAEWFRMVGTTSEPGTRLMTVSREASFTGATESTRVLEVAGGTRISDVLRYSGLDPARLLAVLVGGYHGAWLPAEAFNTRLDAPGLAPFGAAPGAGVLFALDTRLCPLRVAADIVNYLAQESAGQCGPCVNGLPAMADLVGRLAAGEGNPTLPAETLRLASLAGPVAGRGACHHPDGTARFVRSTLTVFRADVAAHLTNRCSRAAS